MKKSIKFIMTTLLVFTLVIGFVGSKTTDVNAANYVTNKEVTIKVDVPWYMNKYKVSLGNYTSPYITKDYYFYGTVTLPSSSSIASKTLTLTDVYGQKYYTTVKISKNNMNKTIVVEPIVSMSKGVTGVRQVTTY